jgi:hypothetical protein
LLGERCVVLSRLRDGVNVAFRRIATARGPDSARPSTKGRLALVSGRSAADELFERCSMRLDHIVRRGWASGRSRAGDRGFGVV